MDNPELPLSISPITFQRSSIPPNIPEDEVVLMSDVPSRATDPAVPKFQRSRLVYHKSRMILPMEEESKSNKSLDAEISAQNDKIQQKITAYTQFINCFGTTIPWIFGFFFVAVLFVYITGFIQHDLKQYLIWGMIGVLVIGSILGMFGMIKYGVISDHIHDMKMENDTYKEQLEALTEQKDRFQNEVNDLQETVNQLSQQADEMEKQEKQFSGLMEELKEIHGDTKDIKDVLNDVHQIFDESKLFWLENERAHLLTAFYECAKYAKDRKMGPKEFKKLKLRLTKQQQQWIDEQGTYQSLADENGQIDVVKFQDIVEKILVEKDGLKESMRDSLEDAMMTRGRR